MSLEQLYNSTNLIYMLYKAILSSSSSSYTSCGIDIRESFMNIAFFNIILQFLLAFESQIFHYPQSFFSLSFLH